jgi:hypothetical protein
MRPLIAFLHKLISPPSKTIAVLCKACYILILMKGAIGDGGRFVGPFFAPCLTHTPRSNRRYIDRDRCVLGKGGWMPWVVWTMICCRNLCDQFVTSTIELACQMQREVDVLWPLICCTHLFCTVFYVCLSLSLHCTH